RRATTSVSPPTSSGVSGTTTAGVATSATRAASASPVTDGKGGARTSRNERGGQVATAAGPPFPPSKSREPTRSVSVGVLVLPPSTELGRWRFRRSLEQEAVVRRDERVGRHHRVGVVDGSVLAREGDPARALAQPVLELSPDLA